MHVYRVRRVGNSNLVVLPRALERDGYVAGADVFIRQQPDGSVSIVPVDRVRLELIDVRFEAGGTDGWNAIPLSAASDGSEASSVSATGSGSRANGVAAASDGSAASSVSATGSGSRANGVSATSDGSATGADSATSDASGSGDGSEGGPEPTVHDTLAGWRIPRIPTPATEVVRDLIRQRHSGIMRAAFRVGAEDVRVVGPIAMGTATIYSPVDFVVRFRPLNRKGGPAPLQRHRRETLRAALQAIILERPVTVRSETMLRGRSRAVLEVTWRL